MTTTSGFSVSGLLDRRGAVARLGDHGHVGLAVDEQLEPVTHGHVVVRQQNPIRPLCSTIEARSVRSALSAPGSSCPGRRGLDLNSSADEAARSCMPSRPKPCGPFALAAGSNPTPSSSTIEHDRVLRAAEDDVHAWRARVPGDVGHGFLRDAV